MSAKESRGPSVGTHTKPSGHGRRGLPTGRPSRIVGSSETAVRFARSPVAQLVERLTVNQEVAGSSPARGANFFKHLRPLHHARPALVPLSGSTFAPAASLRWALPPAFRSSASTQRFPWLGIQRA